MEDNPDYQDNYQEQPQDVYNLEQQEEQQQQYQEEQPYYEEPQQEIPVEPPKPEKNKKVKKHIVSLCPYGEIKTAFENLSKLENDFDPESIEMKKMLKEYSESHQMIVEGNSLKFVINQTAVMGDEEDCNQYYDPRTEQMLIVDFYNETIVGCQPADESFRTEQSAKEYQTVLEQEADRYLSKYFEDPIKTIECKKCCSYVKLFEMDEPYIILSIKSLNFKNFWGGEWISQWQVKEGHLQGQIQIMTHFYEEGNIQYQQTKPVKTQIALTNDIYKNAKVIFGEIEKQEQNLQQSLSDFFETINDNIFKTMRRQLPGKEFCQFFVNFSDAFQNGLECQYFESYKNFVNEMKKQFFY